MAAPTPAARIAFLGAQTGNDFMAFYLDDYKGEAHAASIIVNEGLVERTIRLPDNPCRFAILANWNTDVTPNFNYSALSGENLYENAGFELYYGFDGVIAFQLFPSQSTGLLPVSNTNRICVRTRPGVARTLWFAWFS